jgi:hypothetical protein
MIRFRPGPVTADFSNWMTVFGQPPPDYDVRVRSVLVPNDRTEDFGIIRRSAHSGKKLSQYIRLPHNYFECNWVLERRVVPRGWIEQPTPAFSVLCSTN